MAAREAQAATAVVLLRGCITTVTSNPPPTETENPPPVETPECPATPPDTNTPCTEPLSCEYNNACVEVYSCEEGTWRMTSGTVSTSFAIASWIDVPHWSSRELAAATAGLAQ